MVVFGLIVVMEMFVFNGSGTWLINGRRPLCWNVRKLLLVIRIQILLGNDLWPLLLLRRPCLRLRCRAL